MPTDIDTSGCLTDRDQLFDILSRAVTITNACHSPCQDDDVRLLKKIGAKFLGRTAYVWVTKEDDETHFDNARNWAAKVHAEVADDVVLQGAIFEAIYPAANAIPIPPWVFEDLGQPVETRNFSHEAMLGGVKQPAQGLGTPWLGGGVPDLMTDEGFRWFYYRARRYIECGYEALHIGQVHLVAGLDRGYRRFAELVKLIRAAAAKYARRGWVILDAHGHGIAIDGQLLFDFTSRPLSARGLVDRKPYIAVIKRGDAIGGIHPGGWHCDESPTVVEVDNWTGYSMQPDSPDWDDPHKLAAAGRWGYDDISWYGRLPDGERGEFLRYAHRWARLQGEHWFFQPPVTRSFGRADIERPGVGKVHRYRANTPSEACPTGFDDEDAIAAIWAENDPAAHIDPVPVAASPTPMGLTVPEPVAVAGELQPLIGGVPGDASCPWSRLWGVGPGRFSRTFVLPAAGQISFFIAAGGTMSDLTKTGGVAGGEPYVIDVPEVGAMVRVEFDYEQRTVDARDVRTGDSLIV